MKKILIVLMLFCYSISGENLYAQGIEFTHGSWAEVMQQAKKENKIVFIDFFTVWCGPCKMMSNEVFPQSEVGSFFNKNFISWKVDAEKGEGIQLAAKYHVNAYPTLLFVNGNEEEVYKVIGSANAQNLIEHGRTALNPGSDFSVLKTKYAKGALSKAEFSRYLTMVAATGADKETGKLFDAYFQQWPEVSMDMFSKITEYVNSPENKAFQYLVAHQQEFAKLAGKEKTENFIKSTFLDEIMYTNFTSESDFQKAKTVLKNKIDITEREELELDLNYAIRTKSIDKYFSTGTALFGKFISNDAREIGNLVGPVLRIVPEDQSLPAPAKKWALRAVELNENSINDFQLAMVYLREGNKVEADKFFDMALAASKRDNDGLYSRMEQMRKELTAPKSSPGVSFREATWNEVKEMARKEKKLIFIDFYTVWCAPCKAMLKEVFTDKGLGDYYNQHLVSIKVDAEKGEGIMLANKYGVGGFPTFLFVNEKEEVVYRITRAATIQEMMEEAAIALTPGEDFNKLQEQYAAGSMKKEDLYRYLNLVKMKDNQAATAKVFETYFNQYPEISASMFRMIVAYVNLPSHPAFQYLLNHRNDFYAIADKQQIDEFISELYLKDFRYGKRFTSDSSFFAAKKQLQKQIAVDEKLSLELDLAHYYSMKNEQAYMKTATLLFNKYYKNDHQEISLMLGGASYLVTTPKNIATIRKWAEQALALKDNSLNNLTLAMILLKEKNRAAAEKYMQASKAASQRDNDGYLPHILALEKSSFK